MRNKFSRTSLGTISTKSSKSVGIAHVEIIGNGPRYASVFIPCPLKIDRNSCLLVGIEIAEALTLANRLALVHSSNWSLNPLYLGAYASPIKNGRKWRSILSQPDPPYFFAGEATHEEHFGKVHGAYLSGESSGASNGSVHNEPIKIAYRSLRDVTHLKDFL